MFEKRPLIEWVLGHDTEGNESNEYRELDPHTNLSIDDGDETNAELFRLALDEMQGCNPNDDHDPYGTDVKMTVSRAYQRKGFLHRYNLDPAFDNASYSSPYDDVYIVTVEIATKVDSVGASPLRHIVARALEESEAERDTKRAIEAAETRAEIERLRARLAGLEDDD